MRYILTFSILLIFGCTSTPPIMPALFQEVSTSGIEFTNTVENTDKFNIFNYRNFYNGGGVAIGDINNDGLADVFLTSNMGSNQLFLNKGDWNFENISEKAGIQETEKWSTGVVMVDVNADGWLDIYVCNAGYKKGIGQENALFINNKDLTFTEQAAEYGLNENGYTTHAAFFDYDLDGDLDVYILNNSFIPANTLNYSNKRDLRAEDWEVEDFVKGGGDKFFRNDNGKFTDISESAGIYGSLIGFGLGITIGDLNGDNYPDMYVSNDFFERDYLYINQKDGTFKEELEQRTAHISLSSMGADMADINNDGAPEIFVTDMMPDNDYRLKTTGSFENINVYELKQKRGFYHQYMQNTLQLNDKDGHFQEIAQFSGVAASDWSWGALMFDMDNDTHVDLYVCNGVFHDVIDQDFIDFFANDIIQKMTLTGKKEELNDVISKMPSVPVPNKAFQNKGNLKFEDVSNQWGFEKKTFSNGAAYGDLDNDGDLDMIVNNVNQPTQIFQNTSEQNFISFQLKGKGENPFALGATVAVFIGDKILSRQLIPSRGFQSSIDYQIVIGLGDYKNIDSVRVTWPDLSETTLNNLAINKLHQIEQTNETSSKKSDKTSPNSTAFLQKISTSFDKHEEDGFNDFYNERNVPIKLSEEGPQAAIGDVNGDGLADVFIGGATGQAGVLYLKNATGYTKSNTLAFERYKDFEDTALCFFDADGDKDLDLFIGSGGNQKSPRDRAMQDRLFINDGTGEFSLQAKAFQTNGMNTSVAVAYDFDADGDEDLFVGSRSIPLQYGLPPKNYLYQNDGTGHFVNLAINNNESLGNAGMVTDAKWANLIGDEKKELVLVGEWFAPKIFSFENTKAKLEKTTLDAYSGWWYSCETADVDADGDEDIVLGNLGTNFYLKASPEAPIKLWINDFDQNSSFDKIITRTIDGKDKPVFLKKDLAEQIVSIKKQNIMNIEYANKTIQDIFPPEKIKQALVKEATYFKSCVAINDGNGNFTIKALADATQLSCVNDVAIVDVNQDQHLDLIIGGNKYGFLPQFSKLDASRGTVLLGNGTGHFDPLPKQQSGLDVAGAVRQISLMSSGEEQQVLILRNDELPLLYEIKK